MLTISCQFLVKDFAHEVVNHLEAKLAQEKCGLVNWLAWQSRTTFTELIGMLNSKYPPFPSEKK